MLYSDSGVPLCSLESDNKTLYFLKLNSVKCGMMELQLFLEIVGSDVTVKC